MRRVAVLLALGCVAVVAAAAALGAPAADPGISDTEILIGGTAPISGEASSAAAIAKGADAFFKWTNANGGVNGRSITYRYLDDGYDPSRTVQVVRQLVQQDQVFALFNTLGTSNNLAVRDFLNQSRVPQLFVASGATTWGADAKEFPWTIGYIPSYKLEGTVLAQHVLKTRPRARIAVLYQDDDYGRDILAGFRGALGAKATLIKAVPYDPTAANVDSQVAELKATKADTFMVFAFGKFAVQALVNANKLGWRPQVYMNAVATSSSIMGIADLAGAKRVTRGAVSIAFNKDPSDPRWAKDAGVKLFQTILKAGCCGSPTDLKNGYYLAGMASAFTLVDTLKRAGRDLTRDSVIQATRSLSETNNPFLVPGIAVRTGPNDAFPIEQVALQRWQDGHWNIMSGLLSPKP